MRSNTAGLTLKITNQYSVILCIQLIILHYYSLGIHILLTCILVKSH